MKKYFYIIFIFLCVLLYFLLNNKIDNNAIFKVENYKNGYLYKDGNCFVYKIDKYAYMLTNYHVISDNDELIININNKKIKARVLNYDEYEDIAIIVVEKKYVNNKIKIGSLKNKKIMNNIYVYSYNNKERGNLLSLKEPVKFNYNYKIKMQDLLKIKAYVKEGNSGSPVLDENNNVIGMVTMVQSDNSNYAYAIPIDDLMNKVDLLEKDNLKKVNLGIDATSYNNEIKGVLINKLFDNYPAYNAGLNVNDVIVGINGNNTNDLAEFRYYLYKYNINDTIVIKYYRDGNYFTSNVILNK